MKNQLHTWATVRGEFEFDGSWRDIYVFGTTSDDRTRFLRSLTESTYPVVYTRRGERNDLPLDAATAFPLPGECDRLLSVNVARVVVNTHFFDETEIEFDIDPREVAGQHEFDELMGFMRWLAGVLGKDVVLTPENAPACVIFRARPGKGVVEYTPAIDSQNYQS